MRNALVTLGVIGIFALAFPTAGEGQEFKTFGAGWTAGVTHVTDLNSDAPSGAAEMSPGTSFVVGMHVDRWIGETQRVGIRVQGAYQNPEFDWAEGGENTHMGSADLSLLVRPVAPGDANALPYLTAGFGGAWYDLGTDETRMHDQADAYHDGRSRILPTAVVALGVDLPFPMEWNRLPVSLRVEAADHITINSPLRSIATGDRHGAVHNLRFSVGLYSTLRRR